MLLHPSVSSQKKAVVCRDNAIIGRDIIGNISQNESSRGWTRSSTRYYKNNVLSIVATILVEQMLLLSKGLADEKGVEKGVKIKLLNGEEREGKIRGQSVEKDGEGKIWYH